MMSHHPRSFHPTSIRTTEKHSRAHREIQDHPSPSDSNIRSWLEQIVEPSHPFPQTAELYDVETGNPHSSWHPHGLTSIQLGNKGKPSACKRHHVSSRSSSSVGKERHRNDDSRFSHHRDKHNGSFQQADKARKDQEDDMMPIQSESSVSMFEKRPRRKTRQDRYETRKDAGESNQKPQPKKRKSRVNKHTGRPVRSRLDVMNNFASDAIPHTRLTMKPKLTKGLFINGRTPNTGSLMDLAFNEMIFLGRQNNDEMVKESTEIMDPKSHHLDPKKIDEDADFFSLVNGHGKTSHKTEPTTTLSRPGFISDQKKSEESESQSRSGGSVKPSHKRQETDDPTSLLENDEERVARETTYISWSTSNRGETPHKLAVDPRRAHSRTPDSTRAALGATGIFDDIGGQARGTTLDPENFPQEAAVELPKSRSPTTNPKDATSETPRYEDKGVMASPRARGKSAESHIDLQTQEPNPNILAEVELGWYEDRVKRGESRGVEQPNSMDVNGPVSVDVKPSESYSVEEEKAAIPLPLAGFIYQGSRGLPHGSDEGFLVPSSSKPNIARPGTSLHDGFHLYSGHSELSPYGFETSYPRVQPLSYSLLPPFAEQPHCITEAFDSTEFQELPSRGPGINYRWYTSEKSRPNFTRWHLPAAQPAEQNFCRDQRHGEDYVQNDSLKQVHDAEQTMQEYIERIELEAMLSNEQDLHDLEEDAYIDEFNTRSPKCMTPNIQTALREDRLDEPFLYHHTASTFDSSMELQGGHGREWPGSNRWERFRQEPRYRQELVYPDEYMQRDDAELEMTSFWRPNRFM